MIDEEGFRPNVGIVIVNQDRRVFWGKRVGLGREAWQLPQGGIHYDESVEEALYRELHEEVGLYPQDVELLGFTKTWLKYLLPEQFIRRTQHPLCIGQKQKWALLRLKAADERVQLDCGKVPEFQAWRWVPYWYPIKNVISFKKKVYRRALQELRTRV